MHAFSFFLLFNVDRKLIIYSGPMRKELSQQMADGYAPPPPLGVSQDVDEISDEESDVNSENEARHDPYVDEGSHGDGEESDEEEEEVRNVVRQSHNKNRTRISDDDESDERGERGDHKDSEMEISDGADLNEDSDDEDNSHFVRLASKHGQSPLPRR